MTSLNCAVLIFDPSIDLKLRLLPISSQQIWGKLDINIRCHILRWRHDVVVKKLKSDRTKEVCYYHLKII